MSEAVQAMSEAVQAMSEAVQAMSEAVRIVSMTGFRARRQGWRRAPAQSLE